jgi:hypothetical protein
MNTNADHLRARLARRQIDHESLSDTEVRDLTCALCGWPAPPRIPPGGPLISAPIWLAGALGGGGRYRPPAHAADLRDGGPVVDPVILMAIVQRHFLPAAEPAWDDDALGEQLGVDRRDIARAQTVLDAVCLVVPRGRPPLGAAWWTEMPYDGLKAA